MKISKEDRELLHNKRNVIGVGVGTKESHGVDTGEECVVVLVQAKSDIMALHVEDRVPKTVGTFRKKKTDVIEVGNIVPMVGEANREQYDPLVGGVSVAPKGFGFSGTVGLPLIYQDGQAVMLSNVHVFSPEWENRHLTPEEIETHGIHVGTPIMHPSTMEQRGNKHSVGTLLDWQSLHTDKDNLFDAAIATVDVEAEQKILGLGEYSKLGTPKVGMEVTKSGRTSGVTESIIKITDLTVQVNYPGLGAAMFVKQLGFVPGFVSPGDSGSAVVDKATGNVVALVFAGSPTLSIATPMERVFKHFGLTIKAPEKKQEEQIMEEPKEQKPEMEKELKQLNQLQKIVEAAFTITRMIIETIGKLFPKKKNKED